MKWKLRFSERAHALILVLATCLWCVVLGVLFVSNARLDYHVHHEERLIQVEARRAAQEAASAKAIGDSNHALLHAVQSAEHFAGSARDMLCAIIAATDTFKGPEAQAAAALLERDCAK